MTQLGSRATKKRVPCQRCRESEHGWHELLMLIGLVIVVQRQRRQYYCFLAIGTVDATVRTALVAPLTFSP